jgi:CheY-like chemotaxis protein
MSSTPEELAAERGHPDDTWDDLTPGSAFSRDALARQVGHDINNPLGALLADLDLAVERLRDERQEPRARIDEALALLAEVRLAGVRLHQVVLRLRATSAPADAPTPPRGLTLDVAAPATSSARRGRVLVVDDDAMLARSLRRSLQDDHEVVVVHGASGALARLEAGERFDVIVCDLMMPGMTGMDLHEEITRLMPEQAERMVFLTGGAVTTRAKDFVAAVSNLVLEKPFDVHRLRQIVRSRTR